MKREVTITCANEAQAYNFLHGKTFALNGQLCVENNHYETFIRQHGGKVVTPNQSPNYIVQGDNPEVLMVSNQTEVMNDIRFLVLSGMQPYVEEIYDEDEEEDIDDEFDYIENNNQHLN